MSSLLFEEVDEKELLADYSSGCSGGRSDCCTRVCTRECNGIDQEVAAANAEVEWGKFLAIESGVIQY